MEDVLELYAEPYAANRPVVCLDVCSKELHGRVTEPVPPSPGHPAKEDDEYTRHGTANLFVCVEPQAGRRHVTVTARRTIPDFAARMKRLCDELYPDASVIRVVLDNVNTHALGPLFTTFGPEEGWRLRRRLEFHFTPKQAGWLNVAGCEPSVPSRQCPSRRIVDRATRAAEVVTRQDARDRAKRRIDRTFRVADARKKLDFLYPKELVR